MAPVAGESQSGAGGSKKNKIDPSKWKRRRESFSCTEEVWAAAKVAWREERTQYPAWTDWLEAALDEKTRSVRDALGIPADQELPPAPDRLPTGRRTLRPMADTGKRETVKRGRRSFTCSPEIWADARAAWWAEDEEYPSWTDWIEEAITEKTQQAGTTD